MDPGSGRGHDPEGLLSTLPAIATTLLGVRAGAWLRAGQLRVLLLAALAALLLGAAWSVVFPLNKQLWTSSYVLWTGGWAMLALLVCHVAIDRHGWPALGRRFGVNAIAAYAGAALMVYVLAALDWWQPMYAVGFAGWVTPLADARLPSLMFALVFVTFWWLVVWLLDRRRIYIKI
jgi:predicted acyltransferase